ncbi:MAG: UDP-N-acetylmuramoyl-L-alanyl-D-glutamate--2,6-diaminopimelate ligase [Acidobacteria bacterium]|nr:UDP-N-acetylmuramoyl-L-alanyl-D-glutamate--2,6-diaminopimelate ligase [Acidobacteriota bacterium]
MKLSAVLAAIEAEHLSGPADVEISSVESDSRRCSKGSLFVAIRGFEQDGSQFVPAAAERGAVAALVETEIGPVDGVSIWKMPNGRIALARAAAALFDHPAEKLRIIGVTGTSGKTTITRMIEAILDKTGDPVGLIGTIEYRAGKVREVADRTTPDAAVLQEWFARMVDEGVDRAVMEVSSHALALHRTLGVTFAAAVFTNLSRDHFDFHADFEDYYAAKRRLFDQIPEQGRLAVVNLDDSYGRRLIDEIGMDRCLTFGTGREAAIRPAGDLTISTDGIRGHLETPRGRVAIESPILGMPNLYNWMAAVGAALTVDVEIPVIERGIASLETIPGRFERVGSGSPEAPAVIVDYAHKPDALEKLIHAVRELAEGRHVWVVFGCGGDRDKGKRPLMGEVASRLADRVVITSDNPRREDPRAIIDEIVRGCGARDKIEIIVERREAIARTIHEAPSDVVIVIAGKGHEDYQVVGDRIEHFDDREEAEEALAGRKNSVNR